MEDLIKALQIFLKYGNHRSPTMCNHDEFCIAHINPNTVSEEDKNELKHLGFFIDKDAERFFSFRYASS